LGGIVELQQGKPFSGADWGLFSDPSDHRLANRFLENKWSAVRGKPLVD
jgi:hypothetical protein